MKFKALILITLLLSSPAFAEEVKVQGQAVPQPQAAHPSASATVVDTSGSTEHVSQVGEALEQSAGVTVRRYGGLGDFSVLMVRGTSPSQVNVYLDGIPLTGAAQGVVNLGNLPLDPLSRIEVYRGVAPLELGFNLGGAVNLVTRQASGKWLAGSSLSYGSFNTIKADAYGSGTQGKISALIFYSYLGSDGNFRYMDDNGTPFNTSDDKFVTRKNNAFSSNDLLMKVSYRPAEKWELFTGNDFFLKHAGVPGTGALQSGKVKLDTLRDSYHFGGKYLGGTYEIKSMAFLTYTDETFNDPLGEVSLGAQKNRYKTYSYGGNALGRYFIGSRAAVSLFGEVRQETFIPQDVRHHSDWPDSNRATLSGAAQGEMYLFKEHFIPVLTLRVENVNNNFEGSTRAGTGLPSTNTNSSKTFFSPQFGALIKTWKFLDLHGNVGSYYRPPSFYELFGNRGNIVGNPKLEPESGIHADGGFAFKFGKHGFLDRIALSYTYYYINMTDLIVLVENSQHTAKAENIGTAEIAGSEVMVEGQAFGHVRARAAYTFQQAVDRSDIPYLRDRPLPGRPQNEAHLGLALFQPRWGEVFYSFDYIDGNFLDRAGLLEVPPRRIHGAGVTVKPVKNLNLTFEVKNIGNEQISDVLGFPLPGISYFGTVSYRFTHEPPGAASRKEENKKEEGE